MQFLKLLLPILFPWTLLAKRIAWATRKAHLAHEWSLMSDEQRNTLKRAYEWGSEYSMGESMRAICWQESTGGLQLRNRRDGSYGWFGNRAEIVATRVYDTWPMQPAEWQIDECRNRLIQDEGFSMQQCVLEIEYWIGKHGEGQWTKIWASYNAGHEWEKGKGYARDIKDKIMFLREVAA